MNPVYFLFFQHSNNCHALSISMIWDLYFHSLIFMWKGMHFSSENACVLSSNTLSLWVKHLTVCLGILLSLIAGFKYLAILIPSIFVWNMWYTHASTYDFTWILTTLFVFQWTVNCWLQNIPVADLIHSLNRKVTVVQLLCKQFTMEKCHQPFSFEKCL